VNELESRWRDLGAFIRDQREQGHVSLRKLSETAGISNPYLSQIERGLRKPSAEILQQIAKALRISAETLYDPLLHEEQKQTLLRIYQSFVFENGAEAPVVADKDDDEDPLADAS
jgi:transcriptional regulator with XRE-family HTH domain